MELAGASGAGMPRSRQNTAAAAHALSPGADTSEVSTHPELMHTTHIGSPQPACEYGRARFEPTPGFPRSARTRCLTRPTADRAPRPHALARRWIEAETGSARSGLNCRPSSAAADPTRVPQGLRPGARPEGRNHPSAARAPAASHRRPWAPLCAEPNHARATSSGSHRSRRRGARVVWTRQPALRLKPGTRPRCPPHAGTHARRPHTHACARACAHAVALACCRGARASLRHAPRARTQGWLDAGERKVTGGRPTERTVRWRPSS